MNNINDFEIKDGVLVKYLGTESDIIIPDCVKEIGTGAFSNNDNIEKITIGEHVQVIQPNAFADCSNLADVCFEGNIERIGSGAFARCKALREINLPDGIQTIEFGTFDDCENLKRVNIPDGVKMIDFMALSSSFDYVPLEELVLPDSVEYLGNKNITNGGYKRKPEDIMFKRIHLGKGLKTIEASAPNYYEFDRIEFSSDFNIVFDEKYCSNAMEDVWSFEKLYTDFSLDEENPYFKYADGFLLSKDGKILYSCLKDNVEEIIVPEGVEKIMGHAFYGVCCRKLVIPGSVKTMRGSFIRAHIGTLILSEGISELVAYAFLKSNIEEIVFPNSLEKIEGRVFLDTCGLKTLRFHTKNQINIVPRSSFWFDPNGDFNDLEFVEFIDENRKTISCLGVPSSKEQRETKDLFHQLLACYVLEKGQIDGNNYTYTYKKYKTKASKLNMLYGILFNDVDGIINDACLKDELVPEIIKRKNDLKEMALEREDEEIVTKIEELVKIYKKRA